MGNLVPMDIRERYTRPLEQRVEALGPEEKREFRRELLEAKARLDGDVAAIDAALESWEASARSSREASARLELRRREVEAALARTDDAAGGLGAVARASETARRRRAAADAAQRDQRDLRDDLVVRLDAIKEMIAETGVVAAAAEAEPGPGAATAPE